MSLDTNLSATRLRIGSTVHDLEHRALVMGILNRTPDSFYDKGADWAFDRFLERAASHVANGADILDVGGVKAGPGEEVTEAQELDRVVPAVEALRARFDTPISVDTWRASVARECYQRGAVIGNDISGFGDPDYVVAAAEYEATVVATHIRLRPRVADPHPIYDDVVADVATFLSDRARQAIEAGVAPDRVIVDAGLDLGKTAAQSIELLRGSDVLAGLGFPLLLSVSNKTCLGVLLDLPVDQRIEASLAAAAIGIMGGCRILRVHDVQGTVRVAEAIAAVLAAQ